MGRLFRRCMHKESKRCFISNQSVYSCWSQGWGIFRQISHFSCPADAGRSIRCAGSILLQGMLCWSLLPCLENAGAATGSARAQDPCPGTSISDSGFGQIIACASANLLDVFPVQFSNRCFFKSCFADEMVKSGEQSGRGWIGFQK